MSYVPELNTRLIYWLTDWLIDWHFSVLDATRYRRCIRKSVGIITRTLTAKLFWRNTKWTSSPCTLTFFSSAAWLSCSELLRTSLWESRRLACSRRDQLRIYRAMRVKIRVPRNTVGPDCNDPLILHIHYVSNEDSNVIAHNWLALWWSELWWAKNVTPFLLRPTSVQWHVNCKTPDIYIA